MAEIKDTNPVSDWIEFTLDTKLLEPPVVRLRLLPASLMGVRDAVQDGVKKISGIMFEQIVSVVAEWDLARAGEAIPCTEENRRAYLARLVGKMTTKGGVFGFEVIEEAAREENFLKN